MTCLLAALATAASSAHTIDSLMNQLDKVLSERQKYIDRKEARLAQLRLKADSIPDARDRFTFHLHRQCLSVGTGRGHP